jgi:hypothetical protein
MNARASSGVGVVALILVLSVGVRSSQGATASNTRGTGKVARHLVMQLLQNPIKLRLSASPTEKHTFFFRIQIHWKQPTDHFSIMVACNGGKVAIVVYGHNGMVYSYYTNDLMVIVSTRHPGNIDVFRGASPVFAVGGRAGGTHHRPMFGFVMAPVLSSPAKAVLDLSGPLHSALVRPTTRCGFQPATGTATFYRKDGLLTFQLAGPNSNYPIKSLLFSSSQGDITVSNITVGTQPLADVFGITLASLKACGQILHVQKYHFGEQFPGFPPLNFGSNQGEVLASEALEQLMPIDENRVRAIDERWISQQITDLQKSADSDYGPKSGIQPMIRLFSTMEWGPHKAVDTEAQRTVYRKGEPFYSYFSWKFNRAAYHKLLEKTWGAAEIARLTNALVRVALSKKRGPTQKLAAVDLLSDIGPGKIDRSWGENSKMVSRVFAGHKGVRAMDSLLLGLIRARWGLSVGAQEIATAKMMLATPQVNIPLRVRAMEILCFTGQLPDKRHEVASLVKAYLRDPQSCIASPVPGRYLYDLSLCRAGRKILLEELADRHSQLYGEQLLPQAAYNDARPGSPGFNLAIKTALQVADDPKYTPHIRHRSFYMLCLAPSPIFRKFMLGQLKKDAPHFRIPQMLVALTSRKAAEDFLPELASLFARGNTNDKVSILDSIGMGSPKGGNANGAIPIIRSALESSNAMVRWSGDGCVVALHATGAKLNAAPLYRPLLLIVAKNDFRGVMFKEATALDSFSLATRKLWPMPPAGMLPGKEVPNVEPGTGLAWWKEHYAAVRQSALAWAAAHPNYPKASAR